VRWGPHVGELAGARGSESVTRRAHMPVGRHGTAEGGGRSWADERGSWAETGEIRPWRMIPSLFPFLI
jgi:hypothetical protein